jgi:hypothetical protein
MRLQRLERQEANVVMPWHLVSEKYELWRLYEVLISLLLLVEQKSSADVISALGYLLVSVCVSWFMFVQKFIIA